MYNQNPEQIARDKIDKMLIDTGWVVQLSSPARNFRFYPARFFRFSAKKLFEANGSDFQASLHTVGISL